MARLTTEQIQCIDDLLRMLQVEFLDIRYEMVDHIASELEAMEGDFKENLKVYFVMNKLSILQQNEIAKKAAKKKALKLYFKTMAEPMVIAVAVVMFTIVYYFAQYYMERFSLSLYGNYVLMVLIVPFAIVSWKNKKVSLLRSMVKIYSSLYIGNQIVMIVILFIENDAVIMLPQRISISFMAALMLVVMVSLYRCRKHYVGKYI
ncbi:hypothetical protein [Flavobacterium sp. AG291]|uniref:hypothetical protein n=1 Tax=Flavobacterium sp. AG291 TaxID=2184000 RepID=UPI000E0BEBF8|nr:hypothetical protein [Flavobacterium sp. AG291]RDI07952.1 hypothetical protein DEU42_11242 [Flavobacterium sp. AG291]